VKLLEKEVVMNQDVMRAIENAKSDVRLHSTHYDMLRGRLDLAHELLDLIKQKEEV
jgi:hypothetical protein